MIAPHVLRDVQEKLMDAMTLLFVHGQYDEDAQAIAHQIVHIYDDIEFDLITSSVQ